MRPRGEYYSKILRLPYRGAPTTVGTIRDAVLKSQDHYCVRELAELICQDIREKDYISEPLAILFYVSQKCRYMRDPRTIELVEAPYVTCKRILAGEKPSIDCDAMCALIAALCLASGCETRCATLAFKHMFYQNERQYSHICCQVKDPKTDTWCTLDPVAGPQTKEMLNRAIAVKYWSIA